MDKNNQEIWLSWNAVPLGDDRIFSLARDVSKEQAVDRMKTEFISLASHQLRTPLSAIKWFSEMILDGDGGELTPKQKKMMNFIYASNERMIELVEELLNISRIESGKLSYTPEPTNLRKMLEDVLSDLSEKVETKSHKIVKNFGPELENINLDPSLIRQVYQNLISNAVKYTPDNGRIEINVAIDKKSGSLASSIDDNGYGIPEESKREIFGKFYRADNAREKDPDGNGLGLYLIKSIIESAGGRIWFESKQNEGTKFYFEIPLKKVDN